MTLSEWLQNYANEHKVYIGVGTLYQPRVRVFRTMPKRYYDIEDGDWQWTCHCSKKHCESCDNYLGVLDNTFNYKMPISLINDLPNNKPIVFKPQTFEDKEKKKND